MLESINSARIEGNNTTVAEYIESKLGDQSQQKMNIVEIGNMEKALGFIDENVDQPIAIDRDFISDLHKLAVKDLLPPPYGEGDTTPGIYRTMQVRINGSNHIPPHPDDVQWYMDELFDFINKNDPPKYDLLKTAIAHHRFVWIHPFANGNGRTIRLVTYALLVRLGFRVNVGRIINPSAVFCSDRNEYYRKLAIADSGTRETVLEWCEYVLTGLKSEIDKIDQLLEYSVLKEEILLPTVAYSIERQFITEEEAKILRLAVELQIIMAKDIKVLFPKKHSSDISHIINRLKEKKMLLPIDENKRKYYCCFNNSYLLRGFIRSLDKKFGLFLN